MTAKDKKIIEDSEARSIPIFVLTAKDTCSCRAIAAYWDVCITAGCDRNYIDDIYKRLQKFEAWQKEHSEETKLPD